MAKLILFSVSETLTIDQRTNQASIINIREEATIHKYPAYIEQLVAFSFWEMEEGEEESDFQALLRITLTNGDIKEITTNFKFEHSPRSRVIQTIKSIPMKGEGEIRFDLFLNGQQVADYKILCKNDPALEQTGLPPVR